MFSQTRRLTSFSFLGALVFVNTDYKFANFSPTVYCFTQPSTRDIIRGDYENKIRRMSPPEKIFEVFAMQKKDKHIYMSHEDLFKAICPFNYSTKEKEEDKDDDKKDDDKDDKEKNKFESNALIQFADSDRNGLISIYEYFLFVAFMQTSLDDFAKFFGSLAERTITREEFKEFLKYIQSKKLGSLTFSKYVPDPRKQHLKPEHLEKVEDEITQNTFGENQTIPLSKLLNLRELIYNELYTYEFNTFELDKSGNISGEDFAKSIICYLDPRLVGKYFKTLDKVEWEGSVSLGEYIEFQRFLRENLKEMEAKIQEKGVLSRKKLKELIVAHSREGKTKISDTQLEIFIRVLDANGNNRIDHDEFVGVVQNRTFYGSGEQSQHLEKPVVVLKEFIDKSMIKLGKIYDIIME